VRLREAGRAVDGVILVPRLAGREGAAGMLGVAVHCGWAGMALDSGRGRRGTLADEGAVFLVPAELAGGGYGARALTYGESIDLGAACAATGSGEWLVIRNGRWAIEADDALLGRTVRESGADLVAVTAEPGQRAYKEKLTVTGQGRVLGFRRLYADGIAPAALAAEWPHVLFVKREAAERLKRAPAASARELFTEARSKGMSVRSLAAAGRAWDLATPEGLLGIFKATGARAGDARAGNGKRPDVSASARIVGDPVIEDGVRVGDGAAVIAPAFLAAGASVGKNSIVRSSIVGPGATVGDGQAVRDSVVLSSGKVAVARWEAGREDGEPSGDAFRRWPLFSYARLGKRAVDIGGSVLALAFTATLFPLVAIAIKVNSPGPVFYVHRRQGRHGREFRCIKFRTMMSNAPVSQEELRELNEVDGPQFKIASDPRVTIVGEFLRETNIDEIPQFLNVLAGQMSIVGPRPSPDVENQKCPSWREARLSVRPGITGLWQVSRSPERTNDFQEWIYYDTEYVRRLSFGRDIVIAAKTARILLAGVVRLFTSKRES